MYERQAATSEFLTCSALFQRSILLLSPTLAGDVASRSYGFVGGARAPPARARTNSRHTNARTGRVLKAKGEQSDLLDFRCSMRTDFLQPPQSRQPVVDLSKTSWPQRLLHDPGFYYTARYSDSRSTIRNPSIGRELT